MNNETVVYSGSFNPIHFGHAGIIWILSLRFKKEVVVVSKHNPLKDNKTLEDFDQRFKAVEEEVHSLHTMGPMYDNVSVSDIEKYLPDPSYTYTTLKALKNGGEPGEKFTLAVGADCLEKFHKWKDWRKIINDFGLVIIPRQGYNLNWLFFKLALRKPGIIFSKKVKILRGVNIPKISSTEIRERNANKS